MYAKIEITGLIRSETGMHIGGATQFAAIGAVDSPVFRDVYTNRPMIPGSSLKGKIRTLLARQYNPQDRLGKHDQDDPKILRLFGSSAEGKYKTARLIFSDMLMSNAKELEEKDIALTEVKFENTINRLTAEANPRQIERSVRGAEFPLRLVYNVFPETSADEMKEDFEILAEGFRLLEYDYLGGHGTRGYGKVKMKDLHAECVIGDMDKEILSQLNAVLEKIG